jgi:hypothetical protein
LPFHESLLTVAGFALLQHYEHHHGVSEDAFLVSTSSSLLHADVLIASAYYILNHRGEFDFSTSWIKLFV